MLRERQREERRQRILDAAEALVRETNGTNFTMVRLARRAKMSAPTPYNLFGNKGAIFYALLNRALDDLASFGGEPGDGVPAILGPVRAMERAARFFTSDPELFRPLYKYQLGEYAQGERPAYMEGAIGYWRSSLAGLVADHGLTDGGRGAGFSLDDLASLLLSLSIGLLDLWVHGELGDEELRLRMMLSGALIVYPALEGAARGMLEKEIGDLRAELPPRLSFLPGGVPQGTPR